MKNKIKFLLIPAGTFLLASCSSNKKIDISGGNGNTNICDGGNGIIDNNNSDEIKSKKEAYDNGNKVNTEICEEGMILLKNENNALPLRKGAKVSVFGKSSVDLVYGGSGSAAPGNNGERKTIFDSLTDAGIEYNQTLANFYKDNSKSGGGRSDENLILDDSGVYVVKTGETPVSSYTSDIAASYNQYGDAAIIVFSRIAGENWDLPRKANDNADRHYLELDNNERALLEHIVSSGKFAHIIVLLNSSNYIDLGFLKNGLSNTVTADKIDACINIGYPGAFGIMALGKILTGEVNPSGHTTDLVYTNYQNDPTWQNFGGNFTNNGDIYKDASGNDTKYHLVEYEENIYLGYRYYETRGKDDEAWYNANVVYPFGFGLSYTTFSEEIVSKTDLETNTLSANRFSVNVKVTNTGNVAGKQVVQVYAEAPYTSGGVEKPYKVLAGFGKTSLLEKGKSETIEIEIDPYYFASFDNHDKNNDGFKGFTLDSGNYKFHVATDSHTDIDVFTKNLVSTINFDKDPITNTEVKPLFDDVSNGMKSNLSRTDWNGTFPTTPTIADRTADRELLNKLSSVEPNNDVSFDDQEMPTMDVIGDKIISLNELKGVAYNDEKWDAFLNQLSFQDMLDLFNEACYSTCTIRKEVNGPYAILAWGTTSFDGPTGIVPFLGDPAVYGTCFYSSECLVAQTYNLELAAKQAEAIGEEALIGDEKTGVSYTGWYAPRVNLHRSPFSGRNAEGYSEDPFLTGRFAATVVNGVQKKGVYANVKNFALNDQETHRSANGIATWADEQAMRELYFRPFEMAVKEGKSRGVMTSFNRIGTTWTGGDYRLLTKVLREEWGFVGSVISDFHTDDYMDSKQMLYAGGDLNLTGMDRAKLKMGQGDGNVSSTNKKDVILLRNASHNVLYCIANSNALKN